MRSPELEELRKASLLSLISYAKTHSEHYRSVLSTSTHEISKEQDYQQILKHFPILEKQDLVEKKDGLVCSAPSFQTTNKTTGGSTGRAVTLLKNPEALARERAATWRAYEWAGVSIGDRQARFWGTPITSKNRLMSRVVDLIANRLRLSAFAVDDESMAAYYRAVNAFCPAYLYGYVSMICEFVKYLVDHKLSLPRSVHSIITTSEVLSPIQRSFLEEATGLKVFNEYGCGEVGSIAHECELGSMHIMAENIIVEAVDEKGDSCEEGDLVVTDLHNYMMPIIRYRVGDRGRLSKEQCRCGRALPVIDKVHGRAYDFLIGRYQKRMHPEIVMYIFEEIMDKVGGIRQFQVIQMDKTNFRINLVKDINFTEVTLELLIRRFKEIINTDAEIDIQFVDKIPKELSGKLRLVKNEYLKLRYQ